VSEPPLRSPTPEATGNEPAHWFEHLADHLSSAYLRYSFTKGTEQEVAFLVEALGLEPGQRLLDVGCGPGRHARALAGRGLQVVGLDVSSTFTRLAATDPPPGLQVLRADAGRMPLGSASVDVAISLCQGAFGLSGPPAPDQPAEAVDLADGQVLREVARVLRPGGRLALSAFSSYFQVRYLPDGSSFDAATGVNHEVTEVRSPTGDRASRDLWTTGWTPRELRLLSRQVGLVPEHVWAVEPGAYAREPPSIEHPEHLLVATKPEAT
jgi:ubiquinone/menaquinone biosynthesis C-methylase UbiE